MTNLRFFQYNNLFHQILKTMVEIPKPTKNLHCNIFTLCLKFYNILPMRSTSSGISASHINGLVGEFLCSRSNKCMYILPIKMYLVSYHIVKWPHYSLWKLQYWRDLVIWETYSMNLSRQSFFSNCHLQT